MKHLKSFLNNPYKSQEAAWSSRPLTSYSEQIFVNFGLFILQEGAKKCLTLHFYEL
jgi:hypothetical protein